MKKLIYIFVALALISTSCSKEDEPIRENPPIENPDDEKEDDTPEDKTETQRVVITAFVDDKFILPSGTRCKAEFYDADGTKLDYEPICNAASEHSFYVGAELEKGK